MMAKQSKLRDAGLSMNSASRRGGFDDDECTTVRLLIPQLNALSAQLRVLVDGEPVSAAGVGARTDDDRTGIGAVVRRRD